MGLKWNSSPIFHKFMLSCTVRSSSIEHNLAPTMICSGDAEISRPICNQCTRSYHHNDVIDALEVTIIKINITPLYRTFISYKVFCVIWWSDTAIQLHIAKWRRCRLFYFYPNNFTLFISHTSYTFTQIFILFHQASIHTVGDLLQHTSWWKIAKSHHSMCIHNR